MACGVFARDFLHRELNKAGFNFVAERTFESKDGVRVIFDLVDFGEKVIVEVCGRDLYNRFSNSKTTSLENRRLVAREKKFCFIEAYYTNKSLPIILDKIITALKMEERPKYVLIVNGEK